MEDKEKDIKELQKENDKGNDKRNIFSIEEIKVEEMAIDGICGVY